jgi:cardiolipin synthase (CMP-forming)
MGSASTVTLANRITLFRVLLIPIFCFCVYAYTPETAWLRWAAVGVYLAAGISDMLDGIVARRWNQHSAFGERLDPLADKLIINLGYVFIATNPHFYDVLPAWFLWFPVIVLGRDAVIVLGACFINETRGPRQFQPSALGKLTTAFQMGTVLAILVKLPFTPYLVAATLAVMLLSFANYLALGVRYARRGKTT